MNQDDYQALKESGGLVGDAGQHEEEIEQEEVEHEEEEFQEEAADDELEADEHEEDDLPALSEKEKTAFEKRMDRERVKLQEKIEAELKTQYEQKYGKHNQVLESLGGDPDAILRSIQENKLIAEANRLADANGWSDDQYNFYVQQQKDKIEQQKQQQELKELRVQMQINKLRDNPDYAGIASLEREILTKIDKTNGALTVEEAYWALGGKNRAEQIRLEATVREQVKRQKPTRTVISDSATSNTSEKPLPSEVMRDAERMGISAAEARRLMNKEPAKDLAEWRKNKQAK